MDCGGIADAPLPMIEPIAAVVAGVSGCVPGAAPFACKIYATMLIASSSPSDPGSVKGIVVRLRLKRSLAVRSRHAFAKLTPVRGGASLLPFMSGKWQAAHLVWYVARPAVANAVSADTRVWSETAIKSARTQNSPVMSGESSAWTVTE